MTNETSLASEQSALKRSPVRINLPEISWDKWSKPGADGRVKLARAFGKRVRILELPKGFDEQNWCDKGHQGFVLEGEFTISFETGDEFTCKQNDAFVIPDNIRHRSRGAASGQTVVFVVDEL
ncbi:hypothetical protein QA640_20415 [Bradyrhizobium sp. CB82]|uniref:hypothetical protein n=1 Tax=Bradyrhizobium sp. CB82 TaxID=3039159 RepID=UPI0024B1A2DB|nr:hypothetical protein [Bradyrhizobium sp. CB82]WFU44601.1 hypothetical protein QA640_20415 [Bradyrhizobium sp. CB82]